MPLSDLYNDSASTFGVAIIPPRKNMIRKVQTVKMYYYEFASEVLYLIRLTRLQSIVTFLLDCGSDGTWL